MVPDFTGDRHSRSASSSTSTLKAAAPAHQLRIVLPAEWYQDLDWMFFELLLMTVFPCVQSRHVPTERRVLVPRHSAVEPASQDLTFRAFFVFPVFWEFF